MQYIFAKYNEETNELETEISIPKDLGDFFWKEFSIGEDIDEVIMLADNWFLEICE